MVRHDEDTTRASDGPDEVALGARVGATGVKHSHPQRLPPGVELLDPLVKQGSGRHYDGGTEPAPAWSPPQLPAVGQ